jgi:hypothetical protein
MEKLNEVKNGKAGHEHRPVHTVLQDTVPTGSDQEQLH